MKRPVTWIVRIAVAAVIAVGIGWILRPRAIVVETAQVERGTLEATVTAEGKTRVKNLFVVAAPVDGELERISLKAGDAIAGSSVVAHIWPAAPRPLDVRSRAEALAAVSAARAAVERAEATEQEAIAALAHAESTSQTSTRLAKEGVVAPNEAEHAGHEVEIRRQAVRASGSALQEARASLVRAEAAAATSATNPTGRAVTEVRSPTAGRILRVLRESAGPVAAGTPLLEVGNVDTIEIAADFLTSDAMAVTPGAKATILDWGRPEPLSARVRQIEPGAFTKISALGLEEQRVPIILDLVGDPPAAFGNDFHVNVAIVVWTGRDVLTIPSTALFRTGEDWAVFVVRDGRAQLQRVTVGRSDDTRSVIEQGLNAGDEIVIQPSDALRDGNRVAPLATPTH
jgi:HlyD family secretion protein